LSSAVGAVLYHFTEQTFIFFSPLPVTSNGYFYSHSHHHIIWWSLFLVNCLREFSLEFSCELLSQTMRYTALLAMRYTALLAIRYNALLALELFRVRIKGGCGTKYRSSEGVWVMGDSYCLGVVQKVLCGVTVWLADIVD